MRTGERHGRSRLPAMVLVTLVGALLLTTVAARPAHACSCAEPELDAVLAGEGEQALVLAERIDLDGGESGELRILDTLAGGPGVGGVRARFDDGGSCYPGMSGGAVAGLVLAREGGTWTTTMCGMLPAGHALAAAGRPARADARAGPPTLLLGGDFGGPRLAALDAVGNVRAWAGEDGRTAALTTCPGSDVVVELSSTDTSTHLHRWSLPDLTPAGEPVDLGAGPMWDAAVRCLDAAGERAVIVLPAYGEPGAVGVVEGQEVDLRDAMVQTVASAGGTTAVVVAPAGGDGFEAPTLARVDDDGALVALVTRAGTAFDRLAVSPSGEHVLAAGYPTQGQGDIVVMASSDGATVEMATIEGFHTIGWLSPDRAWLRDEDVGPFGAVPASLDLYGTDLSPMGTFDVAGHGSLLGLADDRVLRFGSGFPAVIHDGATTPVDEVRLVDATTAVALDEAAVLTDLAAPEEPSPTPTPPTAAASLPSDDRGVNVPLVLALLALLVVTGAWALRTRARRP